MKLLIIIGLALVACGEGSPSRQKRQYEPHFDLAALLIRQAVGNIDAIVGSPATPITRGTRNDVSYWSRIAGNHALSIIKPYQSRTKR